MRGLSRLMAAVVLVACATCATPVAAQRIFYDGFNDCTASAWNGGVTGGGQAGGPNGTPMVVRYSGPCAFGGFGPGYVTDGTPASEATYRARFYLRPNFSAGVVDVFQAFNDAGIPSVSIAYDGQNGSFLVYLGAASTPDASLSGYAPSVWYSVEVSIVQGQPVALQVLGTFAPTTTSVATPANASVPVGVAKLGWVSSRAGNPNGIIEVDEFDSTRSATPIGRLCRADADGSGVLDNGDYQALTAELLRRAVAPGQPDCNEDGLVNVFDRLCIAKRGGEACP